jgi:ABC-2 type transport system permease protein
MSSLAAIFYREGKIRFTNFLWIFWDLFFPIGYLLVFGVGISYTMEVSFGGQAMGYNDFFLAGVLVMASFGIASNTSWGFFMDRDNGIFYEMLTYPMARATLLFGKALFNLLLALVQACITLGLAWFLLDVPVRPKGLPLLAVGIVGGTAGWFFFYAIFALRIRRNDAYNSVNSLLYFVFLFASSIFYPLERLPDWFRLTAMANPVTWHVDFLRFCTLGIGETSTILLEGACFVAFSGASFAIAVHSLSRES